jgi:hypothetical protein
LLFQGTTEQMRGSEVVREAYLGQVNEAAVAASTGHDDMAARVGGSDQ